MLKYSNSVLHVLLNDGENELDKPQERDISRKILREKDEKIKHLT